MATTVFSPKHCTFSICFSKLAIPFFTRSKEGVLYSSLVAPPW